MKWFSDIYKMFDKARNKFFPRQWEVRSDGYLRGKPIVIHELAVNDHLDGIDTCPVCGSKEVLTDDEEHHLTYYGTDKNGRPLWYAEFEETCAHCGSFRTVRSLLERKGVVMYTTPRA